MSAHKAAHPDLGAPTVPSVSRLLHHPSPALAPTTRVTRHKVAFTANLRTYYPIWFKGLLLCGLTLGLYYPWARTQRQRFLLAHTAMAGHPLALNLNSPAMARLHALQASLGALALGSVWWLQGRPRVLALGALMVLWPVALHLGQRIRLAHTSWQGQALRFTGKLGQAARLIRAAQMLSPATIARLHKGAHLMARPGPAVHRQTGPGCTLDLGALVQSGYCGRAQHLGRPALE